MKIHTSIVLFAVLAAPLACRAQSEADRNLAAYFRAQTAALHDRTVADLEDFGHWQRQREDYREQLREMLGLSPLPQRTPLHATITGTEEAAQFTVEKLHFQPVPGLYVTANLYVPKPRPTRAPTILYLSGHAPVREGNVSFGSKVAYQQHGEWYARNGYVCLTLDSMGELAEISGMHHGTYSAGRWWWNARGYTTAGVEAWDAIRAIDYLETRPEVDAQRIGVTGRSGGGAGSWWVAALDERIKVAVPVAGMTDLQNQVIDGRVARHCDCMFMVNTYRWDFAKIGALVAPRPLLVSNSDKDDIFPLDGVVRLHREIAGMYRLYEASDKLGLLITEGPHQDTQDLQVPAFRWFNRFLKADRSVIDGAATKFFTPAQLRVFTTVPPDERNTTIDETFVPVAKPVVPADRNSWAVERDGWMQALREKCFAGWPTSEMALMLQRGASETDAGVTRTRWEYASQESVPLPLFVFTGAKPATNVELVVLDELEWSDLADRLGDDAGASKPTAAGPEGPARQEHRFRLERVRRGEIALAYLAPRGIGPTAWTGDPKAQTQLRRRFMLVGQTLDGMRVWDVRRAVEALDQAGLFPGARVHLSASRHEAVNAMYASLFCGNLSGLDLTTPPASHATGPDYLNVLRFLDVPQTLAMAAERVPVRVHGSTAADWTWAITAARQLGWPQDRLTFSGGDAMSPASVVR